MTRTTFIAEIGSNHNGDPARAQALIDVAAAVGCTAVKFQYFTAASLYAAGFTHRVSAEAEVPREWLPVLAERARGAGMHFGVSVFDEAGAAEAAEHCDYLKVSSYSVLDIRLLRLLRRIDKPVVLAVGMAAVDEIADALRALTGGMFGSPAVTLLHCVSGYPTPPDQANLRAIQELRWMFRQCAGIGWSDHTGDIGVVLRAVCRYGADMVECHLDLGDLAGVEAGAHCWLPSDLRLVIAAARTGSFAADGDGLKVPQPCELAEIQWRADPADGLRPRAAVRAGLLSPADVN